jgi:hypothetical protein
MPNPEEYKRWNDLWPDADDTGTCAHALRTSGISPPELANARNILLEHRDPRGVFYTWLDHKTRPPGNDVDAVVVSNALLWLGQTPETQPSIDHLNKIIADNAEHNASWYYLNEHLTIYYMLTRAMRYGGVTGLERSKPLIVERTLQRRQADGGFGSDLQTALAISVLLNCDARAEVGAAVEALVNRQRADGSWTAHAFYCAQKPPLPGTIVFWIGSAELTTVMCLEAIARSRAT